MQERWLAYASAPQPYRSPIPPPLPVHTERCVIRCYQPGDGPKLFAAIAAGREQLLPWMLWVATDHQSPDDSIYYVERVHRQMQRPGCTDFHMGIFDKRSGEVLGGTGLHQIDITVHQAELGFWIRGDRHREGLCNEAIRGVIRQAFAPQQQDGWGIRRLVAFVDESNPASIRTLEKVGLRREGRHVKARYRTADALPQGNTDGDQSRLLHRAQLRVASRGGKHRRRNGPTRAALG